MADESVTRPSKQRKLIDLSGQRFGRLIVIHRDTSNGLTPTRWLCKCNCGATKIILASTLVSGKGQSCGCLRKEVSAANSTKHGGVGTLLYNAWCTMIGRCENENHISYKNYGARGIYVCERWKDFALFKQDMGERPKGAWLERRDNDGPYSPDNCHWATRSEQQRNTRRSVRVTAGGQTKTLIEWSEDLGVPYTTIDWRWQQRWTPEEIVFGRQGIGRNKN